LVVVGGKGFPKKKKLVLNVSFSATACTSVCWAVFAGNGGYLDKIDPKDIGHYEHDLYIALDREEKILAAIREKGDFSDETKASLSAFLENFAGHFTSKK
jgi:F0F1-type ATP synthase alpha subunit